MITQYRRLGAADYPPPDGVFKTQEYGAVVAEIRDGDNAVEMKDNGNGTFDLTVFSDGDDMTAFGLKMADLVKLRMATDEAMLRLVRYGVADR